MANPVIDETLIDEELDDLELETDLLPTPGQPQVDRRAGDRRGRAIQVIRFTNERRLGGDRRRQHRRGFDRVPVELDVRLRHAGRSLTCPSVDVSVLGISVGGAVALPVGALVRLAFSLPDDLAEFPIFTWAQVVGSETCDATLRLRFVGLRACDARRIGRFVADSARQSPPDGEAPYRF
jgi:hypothetical protein